MTRTAKWVLRAVGILLALVVLVPASYIGYLYLTYIDETTTEGTAYGFTIGQSKQDAYKTAQTLFRGQEIVAMDTTMSREEEMARHPWLETEFHPVAQVKERFEHWDHWGLWLHGEDPVLLCIVLWEGNEVSGVGQPGELGNEWQPSGGGLSIHVGQSYPEVYEVLMKLDDSNGYEILALRTGWMARRQPVEFTDEEYRFVEPFDRWTLLVDEKWRYFNTIELSFADGALERIHRHRQYFELP